MTRVSFGVIDLRGIGRRDTSQVPIVGFDCDLGRIGWAGAYEDGVVELRDGRRRRRGMRGLMIEGQMLGRVK